MSLLRRARGQSGPVQSAAIELFPTIQAPRPMSMGGGGNNRGHFHIPKVSGEGADEIDLNKKEKWTKELYQALKKTSTDPVWVRVFVGWFFFGNNR